MEKDKLRLTALDGLRGFAILLVFFSHIPFHYTSQFLPHLFLGWIYQNGVTGVTFLFILSGFLMSTIYPNPQSARAFLQKRYTRIFPLFLTMCVVMLGGLSYTSSALVLALILLGMASCTHIIWVFIVKKLPKSFGRALFYLFLCIQAATALLYVFWVNKISFAQFASLPTIVHSGIIYLVNATLTLPLGQYVPMLDGVYWTLVAEVLFYILFPTIVVPIAKFLYNKPWWVKILFLLSLFPLFGGIHVLSYKIYVLSLVQPALFFYFATGIFLGYFYKRYHQKFSAFSEKIFPNAWGIILFFLFLVTIAGINDLSFLGDWISPWVRMIFAIPLTFFVAVLLDKKTFFSKLFDSKLLTYIGTVSYSMYLSHSLVIHIANLLYRPTSLSTELFFTFTTLLVAISVASILFFLLEKPYFQKREQAKVQKEKQFSFSQKIAVRYLLIGITICYLIGVFAAYQSKNGYNFFSLVVPLSANSFNGGYKQNNMLVLQKAGKITVNFPAAANNLGLVAIRTYHTPQKGTVPPQAVYFSLMSDDKQIASSAYSLDEFDKGLLFPFGFPNQTDSKGRTYHAQFILSNSESAGFISFDKTSAVTVYSADKKALLTHPAELFQLIAAKVAVIVDNKEAVQVALLGIPFFLFALYCLMVGKKRNFGYN